MRKSTQTTSRPAYYSYYNSSRKAPAPKPKRHPARILFFFALILVGYAFLSPKAIHADVQKPKVPLFSKSQTVCLDPGHGGVDPGATSTDGVINERDINLDVALTVRQILNTQGYQVFMTRTTNDPSMDNRIRYTYCNDNHASVMVSIHHNFFSDSSVDYNTALFYKSIDQGLATSIVNTTSSQLNIPNNGVAQFEDGVLSESKMPAAVSEGFFITSTAEYTMLTQTNSTRLNDEAKGIASGIMNYLRDPKAADAAIVPGAPVLTQSGD